MLLSEFKDKIGASQRDVENWTSRLELRSKYAPTTPGVARQYSRENVLELAVLAALVGSGFPPRTAASYADYVLRQDQWKGPKAWFVFPAGEFNRGTATDNPAGVSFADLAAESPTRGVTLIHVGKIVETVDGLFAQEEKP